MLDSSGGALLPQEGTYVGHRWSGGVAFSFGLGSGWNRGSRNVDDHSMQEQFRSSFLGGTTGMVSWPQLVTPNGS